MEITRARTQPGAAVCAETFKVARMLIQARPAAAEKNDASASVCARTRPHSAMAKIRVAPAITASGEKRRRASAKTAAPASAPTPKKASIAPKPLAPNLLAINGSSAQNALAKRENTSVRASTVRIRGSWRAERRPKAMASANEGVPLRRSLSPGVQGLRKRSSSEKETAAIRKA